MLIPQETWTQLGALPWWAWIVAAFIASYAVLLRTAFDLVAGPDPDQPT